MEKVLQETYTDISNPGAFGSVRRLHDAVRNKRSGVDSGRLPGGAGGKDVSIRDVKSYLAKTNSYNLYRPVRHRFERIPIYAHGVDQQWQADLADMEMLTKSNDGYRYILTVVDTLSKFAFAEPVKSKRGADVSSAMKAVLDRAAANNNHVNTSRCPERLQTDKGSEFYNPTFKKLMHK